MSYDITGYKLNGGDTRDSFHAVMNGESEYQGATLTQGDIDSIDTILIRHGFTKIEPPSLQEYLFRTINVSIISDCVGISMPYWDDAKDDYNLAMTVVTELFKKTGVVFWDTQNGAIVTDAPPSSKAFAYGLRATNDLRDRNVPPRKTWWKFW
jgi:hypothetical protein